MAIHSLCRPHTLVCPSKLLTNPKNTHLLLHNNYYSKSVKYSTIMAISSDKFSELKLESSKLNKKDELHATYGLEREAMPKHIALALDGNRRWLKAHGRELDYTPFFDKNMVFAQLCLKWGVPKGTSFMWGLSNYNKRGEKVNDLFLGQFQKFMEDNLVYFHRNGVKVMAMGETSLLPKSLQDTIRQVEEETRKYTNLELALPVCYTGQRDITNATKKLCEKVKEGLIEPSDINEETIEKELSIPSSPIPDLFIRVGGELRIGALLAWQIAQIELYFSDTMAPEFNEHVFLDALRSYQQRNRKFGK